MALEDLEEHGVLLPEEEWGEHALRSTMPHGVTAVVFVVACIALVVAYLGDGRAWTWIGIGAFLVSFYVLVWLCDVAIVRQRERMEGE